VWEVACDSHLDRPCFVLNELWVPESGPRLPENILDRCNNPGQNLNWTGRLDFHNDAAQRHWIMAHFNRVTSEIIAPVVSWESPDGWSHSIFAKRAIYTNGQWRFFNAERLGQSGGRTNSPCRPPTAFMTFPCPKPRLKFERNQSQLSLRDEAAKGPQLSVRELLTYLHWHPHIGPGKTMAVPHDAIARPIAAARYLPGGGADRDTLWRAQRPHNVFFGVAGSIFICFATLSCKKFPSAWASPAYLPPFVAAWLPNILFGGTGIVLMFIVRLEFIFKNPPMPDADYQLVNWPKRHFQHSFRGRRRNVSPVVGPVAEAQALYVNHSSSANGCGRRPANSSFGTWVWVRGQCPHRLARHPRPALFPARHQL